MRKPEFNLAFLTVVLLLTVSMMPNLISGNEEDSNTDLTLRFSIPEPNISFDGGHSIISVEGWGTTSIAGDAVLPERTYYIPIDHLDEPQFSGYDTFGSVSIELSCDPVVVPFPGTSDRIYSPSEKGNRDQVKLLGTLESGDSRFMMIRLSPFEFENGILEYPAKIEIDFSLGSSPFFSGIDIPEDLKDPTVDGEISGNPLWNPPIGVSESPQPGATYHNTTPDTECLIITSSTLNSSLEDLADWKTRRGVYTRIVETSWIYNNFAGTDNQEKIRNCIKSFYTNEDLKWVILGGDHSVVPTRLAYIPDGYGDTGSDGSYAPADGYYGDIAGSGHTPYDWDGDNDGNFGEYSDDGIDLSMEVYVGRLSATSTSAMGALVTNILNYEKSPPTGGWYNRSILAGAFSNYDRSTTSNDTTDEAKLKEAIRSDFLSSGNYNTYTLYERAGINPSTFSSNTSLTTTNVVSAIDDGAFMVNLAGHGSSTGIYRRIWSSDTNSNGICDSGEYYDTAYYSTSASQSNGGKKPLFYNDACNNGEFDRTWCLSEDILRDVGIGAVGAGRVSWYAVGWTKGTDGGWYNQGHDYRFWEQFFAGNYQPGKALALSHSDYISDKTAHNREVWKNLIQYNLMGDPEIPIYNQTPDQFSVTHSDPIPTPGNNQFTVKDGSGDPVSGAVVCLMNGTVFYGFATTDALGQASINIPSLTMNMDLTVTKRNFKPYISTVSVGDDVTKPEIGMVILSNNQTGDPFQISTTVTDDVEVKNVTIEYGWGPVQPVSPANSSMILVGSEYVFNGTHPLNSTDSFWYSIGSRDKKGNWNHTNWAEAEIADNDLPLFLGDNSSSIATTGDIFTLACLADDNIGISTVFVDYSLDGIVYTDMELTGSGYDRKGTILIPDDNDGTIYFRFNLTDGSGNFNLSMEYFRDITDNDAPEFIEELTQFPATTGDEITFHVRVVDNIEIELSRLVYQEEGHPEQNISMSTLDDENFTTGISMPDRVSNFTYHFYFTDGMGNILRTGDRYGVIIDDDSPEFSNSFSPSKVSTGSSFKITINAMDNIGIGDVDLFLMFPGDALELEVQGLFNSSSGRWEVEIDAPNDRIGNITWHYVATDLSGNQMDFSGDNITIFDIELPVFIEDLSDASGETNRTARFICLVSDNVGISEVKLNVDWPNGGSPSMLMNKSSSSRGIDRYWMDLTIPIDIRGELEYRFEYTDSSRQKNNSEYFTIPVLDIYDPVINFAGFSPYGGISTDPVDELTTGDKFNFSTDISDNIRIYFMTLEYKFPANESVKNMTIVDHWYNYNVETRDMIQMPDDIVGIFQYRLIVGDGTNIVETEWILVPLVDNDAPVITAPYLFENLKTGQECKYSFGIQENIAITQYHASIPDHPDAVIEYELTNSSLILRILMDTSFPSPDTVLRVNVSDGSFITEFELPLGLFDNTPPVIGDIEVSQEMELSSSYPMLVPVTDNKGWSDFTITWKTGESTDIEAEGSQTETGLSATLTPPGPGSWMILVEVWDENGNKGWETVSIVVTDDIDPVAVISEPSGMVHSGGSITLDGTDSTDNTEISSYTWTVSCPDGSEEVYNGSILELDPEIAGIYNVTLSIEDRYGNIAESSTSITVTPFKEEEDPEASDAKDDWILPAMVIGSVVLFLIVLLVIFLAIRRKKEVPVEEADEEVSWD